MTFDLKTGSFLSATTLRSSGRLDAKEQLLVAQLHSGTAKTFLLEYAGHLVEYDERLQPTQDIVLPHGMALRVGPHSYSGFWSSQVKARCYPPNVYPLNDRQELIEGCGHEVAVTEEQGRIVFAQTYGDPVSVWVSAISEDGTRIVLAVEQSVSGDPPLRIKERYVLYDLRGKSPREIDFDIETNSGRNLGYLPTSVAVSPDGNVLGVVSQGKVWIYNLPQ